DTLQCTCDLEASYNTEPCTASPRWDALVMKTPFYGTWLFFCMVVFGCLAFRNGTAREGPYTFALSATLLVIGGLGSLGMLVLGVTSARAGWYWAMVAGLVLLVVPVW